MAKMITSILGETRPVEHTWPDGFHQCPFCGYPASPRCENPACPASIHATEANRYRFIEAAQLQERKQAEEVERRRNHERAMRRIEAEQKESVRRRHEWHEAVETAGGCHHCSDMYHWKIRRHRATTICPKMR